MRFFIIGLGLHLLVLASHAAEGEKKQQKELVMLEIEPTQPDDRTKRASQQDELKLLRQSAEVPPEYLSLLQQLSAQQRDQSASAQQPQYVQQLVLSKDGRQVAPTRYVLSQDGRLLEESVAYLGQSQQYAQIPAQYAAFQQQQPAQQSQAQARQPPPARPAVSPELAEFSRQQQRLQQEYADAPLRAQIAGGAARARQRAGQQPPSVGPTSQSPQVFAQSLQQQPQRSDPRLRAQPSPTPSFVYAPVPSDAQAILQQQLAQLNIAGEPDARQFYTTQSGRPVIPQQIIYQQPSQQQDFTQERVVYQQQQPQQPFPTRRPVQVTPTPQTQTLPQQYLIETTRPQAQQQYVSQEIAQQVTYVQPSQLTSQQSPTPQPKQQFSSTLLQPVNGRGLFDPKPSRSSIFVSRSSTPRPLTVGVDTEPSSQKIPVVRLPAPTDQRPLTRQELEALINAGYSISPVPVPVPAETLSPNYLKSKRQQPVVTEEGTKNHVVYENHQDGVQYQYSPGSSTIKTKKSISPSSGSADPKSTRKAVIEQSSPVLTYVLALGTEAS